MTTRGERVDLEVPRQAYYLASVRALVRSVALRAGLSPEDAHRVLTAVDEVCAVALSEAAARALREFRALRAKRSLRVSSSYDRRRLVVCVRDLGGTGSFDSLSAGGGTARSDMAYLLVSSFMDEIDYEEDDEGPAITLTKWLRHSRGGSGSEK